MQYQNFKNIFLLSGLLMLSSVSLHAFDLTKVDFSYLYNYDPVKINYQIAKQDSLYKLILTFHLVKVLPSDSLADFGLYEQKKIGSAGESWINPISVKVDSGFVKNVIEIDFYADEENNYLALNFYFLGKEYYYGIPINASLTFPLSNIIYRTDIPVMFYNGYVQSNTLAYETIDQSESSYFAYLYQDDYTAALPPMIEDEQAASQRLLISSIVPFEDTLSLAESNHLYYVQNDTSSTKGVSIFSHSSYYPKMKKLDELIESLIYICTGDEYEELQEAENKKLAFNNFWLGHIENKELASKTIKKYYRAVKFSNAFLTDYKPGWKTDRGMIYIAFGAPEKVTIKADKEIWEYATFDEQLKFIFAKTPNLFVQHHYTLVREKSLNKAWFKAIQKWRKGDL